MENERASVLELTLPNDIDTFDPRFAVDAYSLRATRLVHAGLVRLDPDTLEPRPYAAKSWRWLDARTLDVTLRDDVRFHSGAPLGPHDVAATIMALQSPELASRHLRVVEAIAGVDEVGPHEVVFRLSRAHATLLTDLEVPILRADQAMAPPDAEGALDGLGPYVVERATRGDVRLRPAEGAAWPKPAHALAIRTVHDDNARALRLIAGRSDVATNVLSIAPALAGQGGLSMSERPGANLTYIVARLDRGPFADVRVRRALSLGIDRAGLAKTLFEGHVTVASTLIPPGHWAHVDLPAELYSTDAARALVDLAMGKDARVHATLLCGTDRFRATLARAIAQELEGAGFDVDVMPLELGTMLARLNAGDFELAILAFPELTEPNVLRNLLHTEFMPPIGYNRAHVHDVELDGLLDDGDRKNDPTERRAIYRRVEQAVRDGEYLVPLWHENQMVVNSARAKGFMLSAEGRWLGLADVP